MVQVLLPETDEEKALVAAAAAEIVALCGNELLVSLEATPDHSFARIRCTNISYETLKAIGDIADTHGLLLSGQADNVVVYGLAGPHIGAGIIFTVTAKAHYMAPATNGGTAHEEETS